MDRIAIGECGSNHRVATLVVRRDRALVVAHEPRALLRTGKHSVNCLVERSVVNQRLAHASREQRGLVQDVGQVSASEARRAASNGHQIH